jgi:transposase
MLYTHRMAEKILLRSLTVEERATIERLARSRKGEARLAERAKIIQLASQGRGTSEIARHVGRTRPPVLLWIQRFNAQGVAGLRDAPRSGRPATYSVEEVSTVVATALSAPQQLGQPFASWTLDRLATYLNEVEGIAIQRSRIDEILRREGLRWRKHETWFGERVDPEFAQKRGPSSGSTPRRRGTAS